jgi:hypothetical protein
MNEHPFTRRIHPFEYVASSLAIHPLLKFTIKHGEYSLYADIKDKVTSQFAWVCAPSELLHKSEPDAQLLNCEYLRAFLPQAINADLDSRSLETLIEPEHFAELFLFMGHMSVQPGTSYIDYFTDVVDYHVEFNSNYVTHKRIACTRQHNFRDFANPTLIAQPADVFLSEGYTQLARINDSFLSLLEK